MNPEYVGAMPPEAFVRGIEKLRKRPPTHGVLILGFDTEYDSKTSEILSYQLSDGREAAIILRDSDFTWQELSEWVTEVCHKWGYALKDYSRILLVSHFSTAELSHIKDFWRAAKIRRVSAAQVYNAAYPMSNKRTLEIFDNYHFWNVGNSGNASLAKVAEKFGEVKMEYDTSNVSRETLKDPRFIEYAKWDAVVCARVFNKFRERLQSEYGVDVVHYPTSAALAMAVYRLHYIPRTFQAPDSKIRKQGWLSLWGGRAEAYAQGDFHEKYTLRDVTSLYPNAARLLGELPRAEDWVEREKPLKWRGLCRVRFSFPSDVKFPCLPVWSGTKLIFPRSGISDCSLDEARVARDLGATLDFIACWEYDTGDTSLNDFMQHHIREKERFDSIGDMVGRELSKLMMNSLIGKLSQNRGDVDIEAMKEFSAKIGVPVEDCVQPTFYHPEKPSGKYRLGRNIMPEWSALILGKARSLMACLLNRVKVSLICSTDSLLIPVELNALVDEVMLELGIVLTHKNKEPTSRVRVIRNRLYVGINAEGKVLFGASHAIHLRHSDAMKLILSEETEYVSERKIGLKESVRSGKAFFSQEPRDMSLSRTWDDKRRLLADGSTEPWESLADMEKYLSHQKHRVSV